MTRKLDSRAVALLFGVPFFTLILSSCGGGDGAAPAAPPSQTYTVGGTVSGLSGGGLSLSSNGANLNVNSNGSFAFATALGSGTAYNVTVATNPTNPSQTCVVAGAQGVVTNANVASVSVSCSTDAFSLGGTVATLVGTGLTLSSGTGQTQAIAGAGGFAFPSSIASGTTFNVRASQQPSNPAQNCIATGNSSGTIQGANISNVMVECIAPRPPPWMTVCNEPTCGGAAPVVVHICPTAQPGCVPSRSTRVIFRLDLSPSNSGTLIVNLPADRVVELKSGIGSVAAHIVTVFSAPYVQLFSDADIDLSYYHIAPVWGGSTFIDIESSLSTATNVDTLFYRHPSYPTGSAHADLHARAMLAIAEELRITGLPTVQARAFFVPTEMVSGGEGNFSFGDGRVTINYGNPPYIAAMGGIINTAIPRFAHEYSHELFRTVVSKFNGNNSCLNEGIADALAYASGYLPENEFGPIGLRGLHFETDGCQVMTALHDVGNCPLWHIKTKNQLTDSFLRGLFNPQHTFDFDSCTLSNMHTGNSLFVLFTEAAGGADVRPALDAAGIPHAATYSQALTALGF